MAPALRTNLLGAVLAIGCMLVHPAAALEQQAGQGSGAWPPKFETIKPGVAEAQVTAPSSVEVRSVPDGTFECTFSYKPQVAAGGICLAGSFNSWSATAMAMHRGDDAVWRVTVKLPPGVHHYKFVVDGTKWRHDPRNGISVDDGHGGSNSELRLGAQANLTAQRARRGDARVEGAAISHTPAAASSVQLLPNGRILIRIRTLRDDIERVELVMMGKQRVEMADSGSDETYTWWEASVPRPVGAVPYTFLFRDGDEQLMDSRVYTLDSHSGESFTTPDWAKDAIWYQIMLERFRDGDSSNNPQPCRPWTSEWYSQSPWEGQNGATFFKWDVFARHYGGDLAGLREKLAYLKDLGINAIYLNPIFQATTHHKYNATSFVHVDEHFGTRGDYSAAEGVEDVLDPASWQWTPTDRLFLDVLKEAKRLGIRVILDGVFNHVGTAHPAFRDVQANGQASAFRDWFSVRSWQPFEYDGWAGFGELPVFRKNDQGFSCNGVKEHIFAVTRRWMDPDGDGDPSDGIDGWRLDVPNEVAMPFWREWRALVKSINPDAYIVGEIWRRADEWLDGRSFDAVMNYPFAETMLQWVRDRARKISVSEMDRRLAELRRAYPAQATYALQNLVDSHDTDRLVSKLLHPDFEYDKGNRQQENPSYDGSKPGIPQYSRARLIALIQMTYVGAPMIYYGDEAGMWGADDPTNRKPMLWSDLQPYEKPEENRVDEEHLAWYRRVIALRNAHQALRRGSFESVLCDDAQDTWVFLRQTERESILVAINASEREARIDLSRTIIGTQGGQWHSIFGSEGAAVSDGDFPIISVPPLGGRLWVREQ